jgi:integrase
MFLFKDKETGFYYVYYSNAGKRKRTSCRTKLKTDALNFLKSFNPEKTEPVKPIVKNFNSLKSEVLKYAGTNFKRKTVFEYQNVLTLFSEIAGYKLLSEISVLDAERFKTERLKSVKPATLNKDIGTLRAVFNYALKLKWIYENPFRSVKKVSRPDNENLSFSTPELYLLMDAIKESKLRTFILFALYTGCRLSEIINLQYKDIDLKRDLIIIRNKENFSTKTGKIRQIPLNNSIRELIKELFPDNSIIELNRHNPECYVFQKENGYKYNPDYVTHKFKQYLRKAGINERFHFHCLRHTFITSLINAGVNINYVKEIAGHSTIQTTMKYIHISTNDLREAVKKINII